MSHQEVPELAIATFERLHGLRVTLHDLGGSLWPYLGPDRFQHSLPLCQAIKGLGFAKTCWNFEVRDLRREIPNQPAGRIHRCHAGLIEWVVPVFREGDLEWMFFAGVRLPGKSLHVTGADTVHTPEREIWAPGAPRPEPVEQDEAELILEHLRQVAARLWQWRAEHAPGGQNARIRQEAGEELAARRTMILRYVATYHTQPIRVESLARRLSLSPSRTSHAVRECCGTTFGDLLCQARLRTAMGLLRHSELSVVEVALRAGFDDVRQLQRALRQREGTTPLQYRKLARS